MPGLFDAVKCGNYEEAENCLKNGEDPNTGPAHTGISSPIDVTAIQVAARTGNLKLTQLLANHPKTKIENLVLAYRDTAKKANEVAEWLLKQIFSRALQTYPYFSDQIGEKLVKAAVSEGPVQHVRYILKNGFYSNNASMLATAAGRSTIEFLEAFFDDAPRIYQENFLEAFKVAAACNRPEYVNLLLVNYEKDRPNWYLEPIFAVVESNVTPHLLQVFVNHGVPLDCYLNAKSLFLIAFNQCKEKLQLEDPVVALNNLLDVCQFFLDHDGMIINIDGKGNCFILEELHVIQRDFEMRYSADKLAALLPKFDSIKEGVALIIGLCESKYTFAESSRMSMR